MREQQTVLAQLRQGRESWLERVAKRLEQAQVGITVEQYLLFTAVTGFLLYLFTALILRSWWMALPVLGTGVICSERLLHFLRMRRRERFEKGNLRVLRIITSSLRSSPSYLHAFEQAAASPFVDASVAEEYKRLVDLLHGKVPLEVATHQMQERTDSADVAYLATIIQVQRELGGDMAKTLDLAAATIIRGKQSERRQRATMSQLLVQVNLLSFMPFVFVVALYVNNPHHFDPLTETLGGRFAVLGSSVSILIGGEFIRYLSLQPVGKRR